MCKKFPDGAHKSFLQKLCQKSSQTFCNIHQYVFCSIYKKCWFMLIDANWCLLILIYHGFLWCHNIFLYYFYDARLQESSLFSTKAKAFETIPALLGQFLIDFSGDVEHRRLSCELLVKVARVRITCHCRDKRRSYRSLQKRCMELY